MPGYDYANTVTRLQAAGVKATTPCVIISKATSKDEQIYKTSLQDLPSAPRLPSPTLLVVGEVAGLAKGTSLKQQFEPLGEEAASPEPLYRHFSEVIAQPAQGQERPE
jgi:siroheme synthase